MILKRMQGGAGDHHKWSMPLIAAPLAMLALIAITPATHAAFILQYSELETIDNGSLFVDTINAPGSPVGDANISDPTKTPFGTVLSAPGSLTSLPGFIPRLCGNETGTISGVAVSTSCRVEIQVANGTVAAAVNGIAYLIDAGSASDSLQLTMTPGVNGANDTLDFFWKSDPSETDLLTNCNSRVNETGNDQTISTWSTLNATGTACVANTTFGLPAGAGFTVTANSDLEVPEPGSAALIATALVGLAMLRRRVNRKVG